MAPRHFTPRMGVIFKTVTEDVVVRTVQFCYRSSFVVKMASVDTIAKLGYYFSLYVRRSESRKLQKTAILKQLAVAKFSVTYSNPLTAELISLIHSRYTVAQLTALVLFFFPHFRPLLHSTPSAQRLLSSHGRTLSPLHDLSLSQGRARSITHRRFAARLAGEERARGFFSLVFRIKEGMS